MTPTAAKNGSLTAILPVIAKDFEAIKISFVKLVQLKKQEGLIRSSDTVKQRQISYKEKFAKVKLEKMNPREKSLADHASGFFSTLKNIAGVLGSIFLVLGAAGIAKMIFDSEAGRYLGKFLSMIFKALTDLAFSAITLVKSIFQDSEVKSAFFKTISTIFAFIGNSLMKGFEIFKTLIADGEIVSAILRTIKSIFSAIFDSIESLASIISDIFSQNSETIKNGVVQFVTKIVDVIVPVLSILASSFTALVQDQRFTEALKSIGSGLIDLIKNAWDLDYKARDDTRKTISDEIISFIVEAGVMYYAMMQFKIAMIKLGAAIGAANFSKPGTCDCGPVTPDVPDVPDKADKRTRPGSTQEKMQDRKASRNARLEQVKAARETAPATPEKQSWWQRAKSSAGEAWNKLSSKAKNVLASMEKGFESAKSYIKTYAEKVARAVRAMALNTKIQTKIMTAFTKRFGTAAAARLSAFVAAQAASLAAAPATAGFSLIVNALLLGLAAYDIYSLYHLLFVSSDGENEDGGLIKDLQADIDAFEKQETGGVIQEPPSPSPTAAPTPAAPAAAAASSPTPAAKPSPSSGSQVVAKQREMAGPESTTPERTMAGYSYEATAAVQAKMKQGDVSAKQHEAGTDILAQNLMGLVPGFNKFTAFDDSYHNKVSPGSKHAAGLAIDFTVNGGSAEYAKAAEAVRNHLTEKGLTAADFSVIDELNKPSSKATGPHIHVQFKSKEAADKYRGLYPNMPLTAMAKDSAPSEGTPFTPPAPIQTADREKEEKQTIAGNMFADLTKGMAALDEMTGGKLGLMSDEMRTAMRSLEDETNKGGSFFNLSSTVISNKVENKTSVPSSLNETNEKILATLLNRQYA